MARRDNRRAARLEEDEADGDDVSRRSNSKSAPISISSDDEEANEDLSLKVVEKALLKRAAMLAENDGAVFDEFRVARDDVDFPSSSSQAREVAVASTSGLGVDASGDVKSKKKVKKKKNTEDEKVVIEKDEDIVVTVEKPKPVEEENMNVVKVIEAVDSLESNAVNTSTNIVLRKLLRGRRYFDPPDSGWETCYNCGEEGHMAVNCASASRRKKPCFICGSLDHNVRQCSKAKDCYICRKGGHRAKDCPESFKISRNVKICLRCGNSGHDMFSCSKEYASDDLKEIQCYVCKSFSHLCCDKYVDTSPREVSCYKCGQLGHIGMLCRKPQGQNTESIGFDSPMVCYSCGAVGHFARECQSSSQGQNKEIIGLESPNACYRCGEVGHFARECQSSSQVKNDDIMGMESPNVCYRCGEAGHFARECRSSYCTASKRNREPSTPSLGCHSKNDQHWRFNSAPNNYGRDSKIKRTKYEEDGITTPRKSKQRGGWIHEDPEEFSDRKSRKSDWNSPRTPYEHEHHRTSNIPFGGHFSGSHPSDRFSYNQFSAPRLRNPEINRVRRSHWW